MSNIAVKQSNTIGYVDPTFRLSASLDETRGMIQRWAPHRARPPSYILGRLSWAATLRRLWSSELRPACSWSRWWRCGCWRPISVLTLETSTLVIGVALAAIAIGSWAGGRFADVIPPRRALGPLLAVSGVAVAATPFAVRAAGAFDRGVVLMLVAMFAIMVPGTFLAAVTPMVTKLRLTSLNETGTIVGRLSAIGTAGAILGTVVTGFVLISRLPVSAIMVGLGVALVIAATVVELRVRGWRSAVAPAVLVLLAGGAVAFAPGGCDVETIYHCAWSFLIPNEPPAGCSCSMAHRIPISTWKTRPISTGTTRRPSPR